MNIKAGADWVGKWTFIILWETGDRVDYTAAIHAEIIGMPEGKFFRG